jgi:hypothetical protein
MQRIYTEYLPGGVVSILPIRKSRYEISVQRHPILTDEAPFSWTMFSSEWTVIISKHLNIRD